MLERGPRGTLSCRFQVGNLRRRPNGSPELVNCASKKCSGRKLFNQVGGDLLGMQLIAQLRPREALRRLPAAKAAKSFQGSIEKGREPTSSPKGLQRGQCHPFAQVGLKQKKIRSLPVPLLKPSSKVVCTILILEHQRGLDSLEPGVGPLGSAGQSFKSANSAARTKLHLQGPGGRRV